MGSFLSNPEAEAEGVSYIGSLFSVVGYGYNVFSIFADSKEIHDAHFRAVVRGTAKALAASGALLDLAEYRAAGYSYGESFALTAAQQIVAGGAGVAISFGAAALATKSPGFAKYSPYAATTASYFASVEIGNVFHGVFGVSQPPVTGPLSTITNAPSLFSESAQAERDRRAAEARNLPPSAPMRSESAETERDRRAAETRGLQPSAPMRSESAQTERGRRAAETTSSPSSVSDTGPNNYGIDGAESWIAAAPFRLHALDKEAGKLKLQRNFPLMNKRDRGNPEVSPVPLIDHLPPPARRRARIDTEHHIAMAKLNARGALFKSQRVRQPTIGADSGPRF